MFKTIQSSMYGLLVLVMLSGCGALNMGPSSQIPLSSAGLDTSLEHLQASQNQYSIHYSMNSQNPPAVIFIPNDSPYTLQLVDRGINRWFEADSPELVTQVIRRIKDNKFGGTRFPSLQAIVTPPGPEGQLKRDLLAYIYSKGYASLSEVEGEPDTFALLPVPPQRNLKFDNLDEGMGAGGNS